MQPRVLLDGLAMQSPRGGTAVLESLFDGPPDAWEGLRRVVLVPAVEVRARLQDEHRPYLPTARVAVRSRSFAKSLTFTANSPEAAG
jgi:hypothetical protein